MRGKAQSRAQCGKPIAKGHIVSFLGKYILFINPVTAGPCGRVSAPQCMLRLHSNLAHIPYTDRLQNRLQKTWARAGQ